MELAWTNRLRFMKTPKGENGYYKRVLPPDRPVMVQISLYIYRIEKLSTKDGQLTVEFLLNQRYNDSRLAFGPDSEKGTPLHLSPYRYEEFHRNSFTLRNPESLIWTPEKFFNAIESKTSLENARVFSNGLVTFSQRIKVTLPCLVNLRNFPFDVQTCQFKISSCKLRSLYLLRFQNKNLMVSNH